MKPVNFVLWSVIAALWILIAAGHYQQARMNERLESTVRGYNLGLQANKEEHQQNWSQWTYGRTTNDYICFSQPYPYADKEPIPTTSHPDLLDCSQFIMGCSGDDTHCIGGPGGIAKTWKKHQGSCTIDFPICPGDDEHGEPK